MVMYGLRFFYKNYIVYHFNTPILSGLQISTIPQSFASLLTLVFEIHELKLKQNYDNNNEKMNNCENDTF